MTCVGHFLVDAPETLHEAADVIVAVAVLPDFLDHFNDRPSFALRRLSGDGGRLPEVLEERAIEAIEHDEMRFILERLPSAGAAAEHLFKEDAGLYRTQEDDVLQVRDINAGGEHVHGDHDCRLGTVAKFPDALQRPVHRWAAGDLGRERIPAAEDVARSVHEVIGVGGVREVVCRKDQGLREAPVPLLVLQCVCFDLFKDFRFESGDVIFSSTSVASNCLSSSTKSSFFAPLSGSTIPTASPSLRNIPCIRTFDLIATTS